MNSILKGQAFRKNKGMIKELMSVSVLALTLSACGDGSSPSNSSCIEQILQQNNIKIDDLSAEQQQELDSFSELTFNSDCQPQVGAEDFGNFLDALGRSQSPENYRSNEPNNPVVAPDLPGRPQEGPR